MLKPQSAALTIILKASQAKHMKHAWDFQAESLYEQCDSLPEAVTNSIVPSGSREAKGKGYASGHE